MDWYKSFKDVSDLVGLTLKSIENNDNVEIIFTTDQGRKFKMYHMQDCCESVYIESVVGDFADLIGTPITMAEEVSGPDIPPPEGCEPYGSDTYTWTFYKLATVKGYVDIRWYGESNGYYSERVDFQEITEKD